MAFQYSLKFKIFIYIFVFSFMQSYALSNESISKEEEQYNNPVVQILSPPFVWPGQGHCHLAYSLYTVKDAKADAATTMSTICRH